MPITSDSAPNTDKVGWDSRNPYKLAWDTLFAQLTSDMQAKVLSHDTDLKDKDVAEFVKRVSALAEQDDK